MPQRTTVDRVQAVLLSEYDGTTDLSPFMSGAAILTDQAEVYGVANERPATPEQLEEVERWLAAHLYKVVDRPYASKNTGGASASYDGKTGQGLDFTGFGQHAKLLDPTGYLASIGATTSAGGGVVPPKRATVRVSWLGY